VNRDAETPVEGAIKDRSNKIGTEVVIMKRSRGREYQNNEEAQEESKQKQRVRKCARKNAEAVAPPEYSILRPPLGFLPHHRGGFLNQQPFDSLFKNKTADWLTSILSICRITAMMDRHSSRPSARGVRDCEYDSIC
jgi:hypothetical protein